MSIKEDVHRIIDELPESDLEKVLHHLKNEWRLRVGEWRVRFAPDGDRREIVILPLVEQVEVRESLYL